MKKKKKKRARKRRPVRLPGSPLAPLNYAQLELLMNRLLKPATAEYNRQAAVRQGFGAAQARIAEGVAPEVQAAYEKANQFSRSAAEGFSTGLRERANELGLEGAEADVVFGTEGFIPSEALAREGAAFTSSAAQLPSTVLGQAAQESTSIRQAGARDLAAKRAELIQQLIDREMQKQSIGIQQGYLGLEGQKLAADIVGSAAEARADARSAKAKAQAKKKSARTKFWEQQSDRALSMALGWPTRPDGRPEFDPQNAFQRLWNAVGLKLTRRGHKRQVVRSMLRSVMLAGGYTAADVSFLNDIPTADTPADNPGVG